MSGKASSGNATSGQSCSHNCDEYPKLVTGYQYHMCARGKGAERYVYLGKDDYNQPEFVDYGPKCCRDQPREE
ncbi:hypothetical protein FisN_24Hu258 [Fistulifera solaris]|uniref:Uncharacterized protein n=1 Tax=Fistulifera solaris TaxID=1519565 RepID=A0A1Z5K2V3_FISSO|nr:hypothetical protein FisN_24Hu258 [Fistulifera solaris]|eukprot:GAX20492.1 hypothetical protein FisN_24Hu258 [Fistulifera solaris]